MTDRGRLALGGSFVAAGVGLVAVLVVARTGVPGPPNLAPAFEVLGTPIKSADRLVTEVLPVDADDERALGEELRVRYAARTDTTQAAFRLVNEVLQRLAAEAGGEFTYDAFPFAAGEPNAMALPGGVILVSTGMLATLQSEAELAAVLAHEIGHVARGHTLDAVRFRLLADKVDAEIVGRLADFAVRTLTAHSFSKTQEDDADEYAYGLILETRYDPHALGLAFQSMQAHRDSTGAAPPSGPASLDPMRDYFSSHPPLPLREAEFRERAAAWWRRHPNAVRYLGTGPLLDSRPLPP